MANLKSLARRMEKLDRELPRKVNEIAKTVSNAVLKGVVASTPVDTSQAVSNWQIGFDEPNFNNLPPHVEGFRGDTRAASSAETLAVGRIIISGKRPGVVLHISNGLDYIEDLDSGAIRLRAGNYKSGFVEDGLAAGRAVLATAKLEL